MTRPGIQSTLSPRSYATLTAATSWEEIWEAGNYYDRVAEHLEKAQKWVVIVGWQIDSRLPLQSSMHETKHDQVRHEPDREFHETLKHKILRLCDRKPDLRFYILMWAHAYLYVFERETWQGRVWDDIHPQVHFVFDNRHPMGASHHEKICLFDGKIALCGGIDLCDERWDTPSHFYYDRRRSLGLRKENHGPYHDLAVQVTGPICSELGNHVANRWRKLSSIPFPEIPSTSQADTGHSVYISRTLARIDLEPGKKHVIREIEFLYRELIQKARRRIILEGQYYWSEEFNDLLIRKMFEMRGRAFEIIVILADLRKVKSLTRIMTDYELRLLEKLSQAARYSGTKLILGNPYSYPGRHDQVRHKPGRGDNDGLERKAKAVYVHSKILIIDNRYLSIGSANFAARALRVDSEMTLTLEGKAPSDRLHIGVFAENLMNHWGLLQAESAVNVRFLNPTLLRGYRKGLKRFLSPPDPDFTWVPWNRFFDPKMSPLYPLKLKLSEGPIPLLLFTIIGLTTWVSIWTSGMTRLPLPAFGWAAVYGLILSSSWLLPFPFLALSVLTSFHLSQFGEDAGIRLSVVSLVWASFCGYVGARMFPTASDRYFRTSLWLSDRLGLRQFPKFLSVLFDPRMSLRSKIAYEGIYCIPFPWFVLANGILLPSALYWALALPTRAWVAFAPRRMIEILNDLAPLWIMTLIVIGFFPLRKWTK